MKETPTLKLGLTLVMTVTQVCVFVNLCQSFTKKWEGVEKLGSHIVRYYRMFLSSAYFNKSKWARVLHLFQCGNIK